MATKDNKWQHPNTTMHPKENSFNIKEDFEERSLN